MPHSENYDPADWRALNLAWWEERAPIHETSLFYRSGASGLEDFEWEDLGSVEGVEIVHPQCHIGTDTIDLARRGATTVGLDFSANATAAAGRLAQDAGMSAATEWATGDVYDSVEVLGGRTFDLVYTGKGALCWLPDLDRWATTMWHLCRPGGRLYVSEFHPMQDVLADDDTTLSRSYFPIGGEVFDDPPGSYADPDALTENNVVVDFVHPLSETIRAALDVGFVLRRFREFPFTVYRRWPWMIESEPGIYVVPDEVPQIPLMYSLMFDRPAQA